MNGKLIFLKSWYKITKDPVQGFLINYSGFRKQTWKYLLSDACKHSTETYKIKKKKTNISKKLFFNRQIVDLFFPVGNFETICKPEIFC